MNFLEEKLRIIQNQKAIYREIIEDKSVAESLKNNLKNDLELLSIEENEIRKELRV